MNNFAQYEIRITNHGYSRYVERVIPAIREELQEWCGEQIRLQNYRAKSKLGLIQIDDIWFAYAIENEELLLTTCYGRSHLDLPQAIIWARHHNDRIDLNQVFGTGAGV